MRWSAPDRGHVARRFSAYQRAVGAIELTTLTRNRGELPFHGKRFLVAEDEDFSRRILVSLLNGLGAESVLQARDGREAMAMLAARSDGVDCVVSDVRMEPVNGLQLLKAIRIGIEDLRRNLPVVLVSGHPEAEVQVVRTARRLDVNGFMLKPVSAATMQSRVAHALSDPIDLKAPDGYRPVAT